MLLRYFYDEKLAHASYLVGCQATGEAIVIDPGRAIEPYLAAAQEKGLRLVGAAETHIHADFVSGARELAARVGATLYLSDEGGETWRYQYLSGYDHRLLRDGDSFRIGNLRFGVMHTPGHTPEHICFLLTDGAAADEPMGLFTGDFVFVGAIGRPDLLEAAAGMAGTAEALARQMFHSVQRFKQLPDYLQIWPAHGAGSACGKGLGAVPSSTVGYEKRFNPALRYEDEARFVENLLEGQPEAPTYFAEMKRINKEGPPVVGEDPTLATLANERLAEVLDAGRCVIDTRPDAAFAAAHVPGTINVPYGGSFLTWAGWLAPYHEPFYLIGDAAQAGELLRDLLAIGLDNVAGRFDTSVLQAWEAAGRSLEQYQLTTPRAIAPQVERGEVMVVDVRARSEWEAGHIPQATHLMLGYLPRRADELPTDRPVVVQCQSGVRSAIGASVLQSRGIPDVMNLLGGFHDWQAEQLPTANGEPT